MLARRDLTLLVGISGIWGFNLIAAKVGVTEIPPILFTALRFGLLTLVTLPFLKVFPGQMRTLLLAAALSGALQFSLLFAGLAVAHDVSTVAIASQLGIPMTTLLSVWLLKETIRWRRILGIVLAFGGVAVIAFDPGVLVYSHGLGLIIASCLAGSLGLTYIKRLDGIGPLELQAWLAMTAWPLLLGLSFMLEDGQWASLQAASFTAWGALLFTSLINSLFAHTAMFYLIQRYPVTSVAPLTLLSPLFSILFGVTLLDDQLSPRMVLGGAITLLGILIVALRDRRMVDTGS
ncbi:MAG: DMT family transporter [Steroidobacteraceae bacterium]